MTTSVLAPLAALGALRFRRWYLRRRHMMNVPVPTSPRITALIARFRETQLRACSIYERGACGSLDRVRGGSGGGLRESGIQGLCLRVSRREAATASM